MRASEMCPQRVERGREKGMLPPCCQTPLVLSCCSFKDLRGGKNVLGLSSVIVVEEAHRGSSLFSLCKF